MALSANRNTQERTVGVLAVYKVKGSTHIYAGALCATDSNGYLVPASATSGLTVVGRADEEVNNTGSSGDKSFRVQQGLFKWANSSGSAVTQALVGKVCYVEDDQTVGLSESNSIVAGIVVEIDADLGIWVATFWGMNGTAVAAGYPSNGAIETVTVGALDPAKRTTLLSVTGTKAYTLADGSVEGQRKSVICTVAASTPAGTLTPATFANGTSIAFDAVNDSVELEWHASGGWRVVALSAVTVS